MSIAAPAAPQTTPSTEAVAIDLRDPLLAAFLAFLIPGLGHMYQRRWGKGGLFMICILGTFIFGLTIGEGKVVYASWRPNDTRYAYLCQAWVGLPAMPALVQAVRTGGRLPKAPLMGGLMAPPIVPGQIVPVSVAEQLADRGEGDFESLNNNDFARMHPGREWDQAEFNRLSQQFKRNRSFEQLSHWQLTILLFEMGTVYTMIAGLLNILAMYDAWGGPVAPDKKTEEDEKQLVNE